MTRHGLLALDRRLDRIIGALEVGFFIRFDPLQIFGAVFLIVEPLFEALLRRRLTHPATHARAATIAVKVEAARTGSLDMARRLVVRFATVRAFEFHRAAPSRSS